MSKRKGCVGEREVAKILREHGYTDAKRGQQYHGGGESPDVTGLPGFHIEVKRVEKLHLWNALDQAEADARDGEVPIVVHRVNHRPWVAILPFEDFLRLCQDRDE
jgi:Holliday junction resolvase